MGRKSRAVTVIGGADGPTSVFLVGKRKGFSGIWRRLADFRRERMRKRAMAGIKADPHTIEELVAYITAKYGAIRLSEKSRRYQIARKSARTGLIQRFAPELAGEPPALEMPDLKDEASVKEYLEKVKEQHKRTEAVPEEAFPIDFRMYHIRCGEGSDLFLEIEMVHSCIGFQSSGDRKRIHEVEKDIFMYYGVSEADIADKTERYQMLAGVMTATK